MDIGRRPQARFYSSEDVYISNEEIKQKDLDHVINSIGKFGDYNTA